MTKTIQELITYVTARGYDVTVEGNTMSVVEHSDDPWIHFSKKLAKPDGVYNYMEVAMGGYVLTKRVACDDFETAKLLVLAYHVARPPARNVDTAQKERLRTLLRGQKQHVALHSASYDRGQFILDAFYELL